jgi:ribosome-binding protein aMBF1 (putative translation factor)
MVFQGEMMTCDLCGRKLKSDPNVNSDWTRFEMDGVGYYVCPFCLQWSRAGRRGNYQKAYSDAIRKLVKKHHKRTKQQ